MVVFQIKYKNLYLWITEYKESAVNCKLCGKPRKYSFVFSLLKTDTGHGAITNKQTSVCKSCWKTIAEQFEDLSDEIKFQLTLETRKKQPNKLNFFNFRRGS